MRTAGLICVAAAALAAAAAPARAAGVEIGLEDERLLLQQPILAPAAVARWKALGVQVVRIHAQWWNIAPRHKPRRFHPADPNDPHYRWTRLDYAIAVVRAAGLRVMLTVTGPGPLWSSRRPSLRLPQYDPSTRAFARFAHAVARRYRHDVDRYSIWNEPNQPGWLLPQNACGRGGCTPAAPHVYRRLVRAAATMIHRADPGSQVLLGELAPIGNPPRRMPSPVPPLPFLRAMGCVDRAYHRLHTGPCRHFRPAGADGFSYHPHPKLLAPDQHNPDRDEAQFGDLDRLFGVLDRLTARHRLLAPHHRFPVYLTEFGYQTAPPDRVYGVSLARQTRYLQEAAYIAWRHRGRVRTLSFYQWDDEPVRRPRGGGPRAAGWQSGLRFANGRAKPVLSTFAAPLVFDRRRRMLWGQVRPAAERQVTLLMRPRGASGFRVLGSVPLASDGTWTRRLRPVRGAAYRFRWTPVGGGSQLSGIVVPGQHEAGPLRAAAALKS